ncbi:MAG: hypothetical protein AMJ45_00405 [Syntrophobacter sp. DG_60]|nr:MAG: hypothetical protein AMJ45_00405 [Syntrophobacter sp. DG_60]
MPSKKEYRKMLLAKRNQLEPEKRKEKSLYIQTQLIKTKIWQKAKTIMLYASFQSEVETHDLILKALDKKKYVLLPRVNAHKEIIPYSIQDPNFDLAPGYAGILEPLPERCIVWDIDNIDLIIIPGCGFDLKGGRLGYGLGCYDRFLRKIKNSPLKIGFAFEICIVPSLPFTSRDIKMDIVITEQRIIYCYL